MPLLIGSDACHGGVARALFLPTGNREPLATSDTSSTHRQPTALQWSLLSLGSDRTGSVIGGRALEFTVPVVTRNLPG
ncbi:hypothetical protein GUITHDRAFT_154061 [Guillardia theta CCMP2712]|uniref:Uncharacterized protein n=1 Tax=Guillardia theta (strain CCMP2712) TaxID=905079 RepID=L1IWU2_GUITC|nr:hypothetical protein GUITHDRAFT_154061 [Guillardia theta CCMP2712]EKX40711.1 hypothetical protein GUITHDRAFT_154061 [Guillardia theta CCMP2712]|eukprot:XP_005827691.1 hypothetical protein GUITHDRAFT_154061 [Guillardia theta CCMP2712]